MREIIYYEKPDQILPTLCEVCGNEICVDDKCYYHSQGIYTCSKECAKKFEN